MKLYWQYMNELSEEDIYMGLLIGMFTEKLPPIFGMERFLQWAIKKQGAATPQGSSRYISYDAMRNTGFPRRFNIPVPFGYEQLCRYIKENWKKFRAYFFARTRGQSYKISQIHIRKQRDSSAVFKMNYHSFRQDEDIISDLRLAAKYLVVTDISTCFPSIYTHSIPWAVSTKKEAKANCRCSPPKKDWGEYLDEFLRVIKDKETNGIFIGPHASNLISEVVLTRVDEAMYAEGRANGFSFIRNIDDYQCYADTHEAAEVFLARLKDELAKYNLSINYKKTFIKELPLAVDDDWKQKLGVALSMLPSGKIGRSAIVSFVDQVISLMKEGKNGAVISYAVKALAKKFLSEDARLYYVKAMLHLAYLYPYLYSFLDESVFMAFDVDIEEIKALSDRMIQHGMKVRNFEEVAYAFYFAIRYGFEVAELDVEKIIATGDCVLLAIVWKYVIDRGLGIEVQKLKAHAKTLLSERNDFEENWLFAFETLDAQSLRILGGNWAQLKQSSVSFFKDADVLMPRHTPSHESYPIVWSCEIKKDKTLLSDPVVELYNEFMMDNLSVGDNSVARQYLECVVGNLLAASRLRRNVRIYRSKEFYANAVPFGRDGEPHDVKLLGIVLDWLRLKHLIGERKGSVEVGGSCFWPKTELLEKFDKFNLGRIYRRDELELVVLKDGNKNPIQPLPESQIAREYRAVLERINDVYEHHKFSCKLRGTPFLDTFCPRLKAVFNDANWTHGGRLYASATKIGFNYQCIPSDMRHEIKIDGRNTVEIDFAGMHPHMLYAQKRRPFSGNVYDFLPNEDKALAKFALLVMLNARSKSSAINALKSRFEELRYATGLSRKKMKLREAMMRNGDFEVVLDSASRRHMDIRGSFYRGTGIRLQNIESRIALDVVDYFSKKNVPVLPVHDSFIVEKKYAQELRRVMLATYKKHNNGYSCQVK